MLIVKYDNSELMVRALEVGCKEQRTGCVLGMFSFNVYTQKNQPAIKGHAVMQVSTRDLRLRTRELMAATARGEKIIITYRGKPSAIMSPWNDSKVGPQRDTRATNQGRNPAHGLWREDQATSVDQAVRALRQPRHVREE